MTGVLYIIPYITTNNIHYIIYIHYEVIHIVDKGTHFGCLSICQHGPLPMLGEIRARYRAFNTEKEDEHMASNYSH